MWIGQYIDPAQAQQYGGVADPGDAGIDAGERSCAGRAPPASRGARPRQLRQPAQPTLHCQRRKPWPMRAAGSDAETAGGVVRLAGVVISVLRHAGTVRQQEHACHLRQAEVNHGS